MTWFVFSFLALLAWSGSDILSKVGSRPDDERSQWKMVTAVGLVMGLHALFEITVSGVRVTFSDILHYLPVSGFYILSMVFGYIALRYIELSVSSPICNSSGALAAVLCFVFLHEELSVLQGIAVAMVGLGVLGLGFAELSEDDEARAARQEKANIKYAKSLLALLLPVLYCLIDALGTFADSVILREEPTGSFLDTLFPYVLDEEVANVAYELTFLFLGILCAVWVFGIKREKLSFPRELPKLTAGVCETAGQFAYIYAIGGDRPGFAAAIVSAYSALSVVWSRIFLHEKLSWKHYLAILTAFAGIVILGFFDA